jgi:hypothetical protein
MNAATPQHLVSPDLWMARLFMDLLLSTPNVRLYSIAPYLPELYTTSPPLPPAAWMDEPVAAPFRILHGGNLYFLPGSAQDLRLYLTCVAASIPSMLNVPGVESPEDLAPPAFAALAAGSTGGHRAMRQAWQRLNAIVERRLSASDCTVLTVDIEDFGGSIDTHRLLQSLRQCGADPAALRHLARFHESWQSHGCPGLPLTGAVSILSKLVLSELDQELRVRGFDFVHIQDDYRIFCDSRAQAVTALEVVTRVTTRMGLTLNASKTRLLSPGKASRKWLQQQNSGRLFREGLLRPLLGESLRFRLLRPISIPLLRFLYSDQCTPCPSP